MGHVPPEESDDVILRELGADVKPERRGALVKPVLCVVKLVAVVAAAASTFLSKLRRLSLECSEFFTDLG